MKQFDKFVFAGAVFGALAGCTQVTPKYIKQDDPFKSRSSTEIAARPYASAKLCILPTENTNRTMAHVDYMSGYTGNTTAFDQKQLLRELDDTMNTRFRETVHVHSLEESKSKNCSLTLALDFKITGEPQSFREILVEIGGSLADDKGTLLDTISGEGKGTVPFPGSMYGEAFRTQWKTALYAFGERLDKSSSLIAYAAALPKYIEQSHAAATAVTTNAIDLAFWDSIKSSANPADFQAYLRKFPNGSFISLARTRLNTLGEAVPIRQTALVLPANGKLDLGNYHALVIGIDNYRSVTPLKTALNDAKTVADLLQKEYGFKVTMLPDATRNQMLDAFDILRRTLTDRDNLLIYYAGHGFLDTESDRGFWLPVDAEANRRANWLSNSDLADMVRATRAKHVLVVADSCYAGTLTRSLSVEMAALDDISRLSQKRARTALVSGGLEPVEDSGGGGHSVFAKAFLDALLTNTSVVDMSQVFSAMRRQVILSAQQTPQYGDIRQTGHEGGDFIFMRRK